MSDFNSCTVRVGNQGGVKANKMTSKASTRSAGNVRPRSPSHAAKNKTPEDRVCEFGWMLTEKEGRLMCKACSLYLDHTRRSTIVEHLRSRKHQRFLEEAENDFCVLNFEPATVAPLISMEICEDESQNTNQSSCDRRSSQSSPTPPAGMTGPYLLKKETHCATILDQLLRDDTFCDVTLTAEGQSLRAHKLVLCLASNYFRQVLNKESNIQNVIVFRDIRFTELKNLITFIYTGEATVDAAELESFMKTAEMLEVTSLCDGQRKLPKNLIPRPKEAETEKNKTTFAAKRALNSCVSPTPSKTRRIEETPVSRHQTKSVASHPSTSGSGGLFAPQVILSTSIKTEPSADEDRIDEEYHSFEQCQPSPPPLYHQDSETPSSGETGNDPGPFSDKVLVGKCPFCPTSEQVLQGIALTKHLSTYHPDKTVFCCENCSRAFLKKGAYEAHKHDCNR